MTTLREAAQQFVADYESGGCGHFAAYAERFRKLLAQQEQKPKAWMLTDDSGMRFVSVDRPHPDFVPLYTAPPRHEWQSLSEEERDTAIRWAVDQEDTHFSRTVARAIEAALKEKNNG
jgi:hypothetical protein